MTSDPVIIASGDNSSQPSTPVRIINWDEFVQAVATASGLVPPIALSDLDPAGGIDGDVITRVGGEAEWQAPGGSSYGPVLYAARVIFDGLGDGGMSLDSVLVNNTGDVISFAVMPGSTSTHYFSAAATPTLWSNKAVIIVPEFDYIYNGGFLRFAYSEDISPGIYIFQDGSMVAGSAIVIVLNNEHLRAYFMLSIMFLIEN